jgi:hypothetical protein
MRFWLVVSNSAEAAKDAFFQSEPGIAATSMAHVVQVTV